MVSGGADLSDAEDRGKFIRYRGQRHGSRGRIFIIYRGQRHGSKGNMSGMISILH